MANLRVPVQVDPRLSQQDPVVMYDEDGNEIDPTALALPVAPNGVPQSVVDASKSYQQRLLEMTNSPQRQALMNELAQKGNAAIAQQRLGLAQNEQALQNIEAQGPSVNLSPLLGLADTWTGSKFSQNYRQPDTSDERAIKLMALRNAIQAQRKGISDEELNLIKSRMGAADMKALMGQLGAGARLDQRDQMLGIRMDEQANNAAKSIHNNPLIQKANKQLGQLQIDRHTVESADMVTPQMLHEISNGIAAALNGGSSVGLGMAQMQDLATSKTKMAQLSQYLTNAPKEGASPAVKAQIVDTLNRLEDAYVNYQGNLAKALAKGRSYKNNQRANEALGAAVQNYQPGEKPKESPASSSGKPWEKF